VHISSLAFGATFHVSVVKQSVFQSHPAPLSFGDGFSSQRTKALSAGQLLSGAGDEMARKQERENKFKFGRSRFVTVTKTNLESKVAEQLQGRESFI